MNSLIKFHQIHGAELEEIEGITIPIRYVNRFQEERQTLIHGAGILDLLFDDVDQVKGKDALQFLQGMVTNDLNALKIGGFQQNLICSNHKIEHRVESSVPVITPWFYAVIPEKDLILEGNWTSTTYGRIRNECS